MLKEVTKKVFFRSASIPGIYYFAKRLKKGAIALFYHGIENEITDESIQALHMPLELFEKHIRYLRTNFDIISLDYLHDCLTNGYKIEPSQVLVTFDDGYKNNLNIVAPYLKGYDIPFTVFISTKQISEGVRFPLYYLKAAILFTERRYINLSNFEQEFDVSTLKKRISTIKILTNVFKSAPKNVVDRMTEELTNLISDNRWIEINNKFRSEEPLNWDDVKRLYNLGVTIGSHCHDHAILHSEQSSGEITYQVMKSKSLIEKALGECKYFAYPNGDVTSCSLASVKKNKYALGFTTVRGVIEARSNPYILPRIGAIQRELESLRFILNTTFRHSYYYKWCSEVCS